MVLGCYIITLEIMEDGAWLLYNNSGDNGGWCMAVI